MPTKIKIFFAFLAVFALFSVSAFIGHFKGLPKSSLSANIEAALPSPEQDTDHDGLSDADESYWNTDFQNPDTDGDGYLDGEEVASGHDPKVPGPDDSLTNRNVTKRMSELTLGGIMDGSLEPGSAGYQKSLLDVANSAIDDSLANLNKPLDLSKLIVIDSTKENQEAYVKAVNNIFEDFFKAIGSQVKALDSTQPSDESAANKALEDLFAVSHNKFEQIYANAISVPVPESWKQNHIAFLKFVNQLSEINNALSHDGEDPMKSAISVNFFLNAYENIPDLLKLYADEYKSEHLSVDSIFK